MGKELPQGYRLGQYSIERLLHRDGLQLVYAAKESAESAGSGRSCRVTVFNVNPDGEPWQHFSSELNQLSALEHPAIPKLLEVSASPDGLAYAVWLQPAGEDLATRLRRGGALTMRESLAMARQVAAALAAGHRLDILHRDLTPENIYFVKPTSDGAAADYEAVLVYGFGVGRLLEATLAGLGIYGHPEYMAPEQISGPSFEIGPASDQYALALVIYQALSASQPFRAESAGAALLKVVRTSPEHIRALRPDLPTHLDAALTRGLARESRSRFPDLVAFVRELCGDEKFPAGLLLSTDTWLGSSDLGDAAVVRARAAGSSGPSLGAIAQGMADAAGVPQVVEDQATVPNTMEHVMRLALPPDAVRHIAGGRASGAISGRAKEPSEPIEISLEPLEPTPPPYIATPQKSDVTVETSLPTIPFVKPEPAAPGALIPSPALPPSGLAKLLPSSLASYATPIERGIFLALGLLLGFFLHGLLR